MVSVETVFVRNTLCRNYRDNCRIDNVANMSFQGNTCNRFRRNVRFCFRGNKADGNGFPRNLRNYFRRTSVKCCPCQCVSNYESVSVSNYRIIGFRISYVTNYHTHLWVDIVWYRRLTTCSVEVTPTQVEHTWTKLALLWCSWVPRWCQRPDIIALALRSGSVSRNQNDCHVVPNNLQIALMFLLDHLGVPRCSVMDPLWIIVPRSHGLICGGKGSKTSTKNEPGGPTNNGKKRDLKQVPETFTK